MTPLTDRQSSEHPIIFQDWGIRAILAGQKIQTRRTIKVPRWGVSEFGFEIDDENKPVATCAETSCLAEIQCPYGQPGDHLWVRETWVPERWTYEFGSIPPIPKDRPYFKSADQDDPHWLFPHYRATDPAPDLACDRHEGPCCHWKSSRFMPRWASRISLKILSVKAERLGSISQIDCVHEGADYWATENGFSGLTIASPLASFRELWNKIHQKDGFSFIANPWVWVIEFGVVSKPLSIIVSRPPSGGIP